MTEQNSTIHYARFDQYLAGTLDPEDHRAMELWLAKNPEWETIAERLSTLELDSALSPLHISVDAEFARTQLKIRGLEMVEKARKDAVARAQAQPFFVKYYYELRRRQSYRRLEDQHYNSRSRFHSYRFLLLIALFVLIAVLLFIM